MIRISGIYTSNDWLYFEFHLLHIEYVILIQKTEITPIIQYFP
jgi:hypothetical protein